MWNRVTEVARGRAKKAEEKKVDQLLDKLLDITTCPHTIMLCHEPGSGCTGTEEEECKVKAHINCTCLMASKIPVMELQWLYMQRNKIGEKSIMKMGGVDWKETEIQEKAAKNKADKEKAEVKAAMKKQKELAEKLAREKQARQFMAERKMRMSKRKTRKRIYSFMLMPVNCLRSRRRKLMTLWINCLMRSWDRLLTW